MGEDAKEDDDMDSANVAIMVFLDRCWDEWVAYAEGENVDPTVLSLTIARGMGILI